VDIWDYEKTGTTDEASIALGHMFGEKVFDNPKPTRLIERIGRIKYNGNKLEQGYFLDFFAGSGTTGQAVMNLNREDNGNRKYLLVEMGQYFDSVLRPRLQKPLSLTSGLKVSQRIGMGSPNSLSIIELSLMKIH